jgi:hypothetical protein
MLPSKQVLNESGSRAVQFRLNASAPADVFGKRPVNERDSYNAQNSADGREERSVNDMQ